MPATVAAKPGTLHAAELWAHISPFVSGRQPVRCAVAWSGGLDSTVLLHLMAGLRKLHSSQLQLRAVHVDHHLQAASALFRKHCRQVARAWRIPLIVLDAHVATPRGVSVEEAAREARYASWCGTLQPGELLLTAQHADDQLETTLLALLRGAGPAGLAGMPEVAPLGAGRLLRPLLAIPRAEFARYATEHHLPVVEDPSNAQLRFDRNFLRLQVLPALRQRWPGSAATVARSARHCATAAALQARLAGADLELTADGPDIEIAVLRRWTPERAQAALRAWFARHGLRSPETRHLQEILRMLTARTDAHPQLELPQGRVHAYAGRLILQRPVATPTAELLSSGPQSWEWRKGPLELPDHSTLAALPDNHGDANLASLPRRLSVRFLDSLPGPRGRSLRKRLQELQVPQWERGRLPLLYAPGSGGTLLAIGDLWLHERLRQSGNRNRSRGRIVWRA